MSTRNTNGRRQAFGAAVLSLFALIMVYNALFSFSYSIGPNYRNVSIDTTVNITNSLPEIITLACENPVTLDAGTTHVVACNATIRDWDGWADITNVSGIFYDADNASLSSPDDNNNHYTNSSCQPTGNDGNYTRYFTCNFTVWYYANAGSNWTINMTVVDSYAFNASVGNNDTAVNTTTISQLLALNITPTLIDYGNMAVGDTSASGENANITNFGNSDINISLKGYGQAEGDGLAFVCDIGNISVENERYSLVEAQPYASYTPLNTTFGMVAGLTLPQQTNDTKQVLNSTYWKLYVPPNPHGICNGTIVFQAEAAN